MSIGAFLSDNSAGVLLAGAAVGWYAASHVASEALSDGRLAVRRRTFGQWMPILAMALVAATLRRGDVALGVLFGTAVAALSLVLGIITVTHDFSLPSSVPGGFPVIEAGSPRGFSIAGIVETATPQRRLWAFVLPAALIALLAGFTGQLTIPHAGILLLEGLAILLVWRGQPEDQVSVSHDPNRRPAPRRALEFALATLLALLAAFAAARAATDMNRSLGLVSGGFVAAMMVSPALVLPMIGSGMAMARAGFYHSAVTVSVGIVLLNLCLGLPLVIAIWQARPMLESRANLLTATASTTVPATAPIPDASSSPAALRFPLPLWRVDTVILIVLGLVLLPLSVGRWMPGRGEGFLMIVGYIIYMGLATFAART